MKAYRSTLTGYAASASNYTVSIINNNVKTLQKSSCGFMFMNNRTLNANVIIGNNVRQCEHMFDGCSNLNQNIAIPFGVNRCDYMFSGCTKLNHNIFIPDGTENCAGMFAACREYNFNTYIPESVNDCSNMFNGCTNFNQNIAIHNNVINCASMFSECSNFNQNTSLPSNGINCSNMFRGCTNYNQNIAIPGNLRDCSGMFSGCRELQQTINIPIGIENCANMFKGTKMNYQSGWVSNAVDTSGMFQDAFMDKQYGYVDMPYVVNASSMFRNTNVWQTITVNAPNLRDMSYMLADCKNFGKTYSQGHLYISNNTHVNGGNLNVKGLFAGCNNTYTKYIHCPSRLSGYFANNQASGSVVAADIVWETSTNGYANYVYNIVIYNNYNG